MIQQIDHVNIVVQNLEKCVEFYRDLLGFDVTMTARLDGKWIEQIVGLKGVVADCVYLQPNQGPRIELLCYISPEGKVLDGLTLPNTCGLRHIAFRVDNLDSIVEKMKSAGVEFFSEPVEVPLQTVTHVAGRKRLCYFKDPEGTLLEFCEYK